MTVKQIISSIPGVPYYNNVVDDWDAKDYSWGVTKKVIEYATYLKDHPESLEKLPPAIVLNGKFEDGAHRVSAIWLLQQRMDPKNPLWKNAKLNVQFVKQGVVEGKVINTYLWHGSRQKIPMLEPRQSVDTGGAAGSNQNAIYATSDPKVAIAMGLTTPGSDTGMFPNDPQMVLFSGKIRKGEYVYLHKLPFNGPDGKSQFVQGGNSREFHSIPGVESIKPIEIKEIPVNKYLNLIRKATPADLKLRKKYMKEQGVAENFADGKNPQDKGDSKRHGVPTKASVSTLRKVAKQGGRKGQLAHWMANMKAGKAKKNETLTEAVIHPSTMDALEDFLPFVMKLLKLDKLPRISVHKTIETGSQPSFGGYNPADGTIQLALKDRHPADVLRTLAHELVHFKQDQQGELDEQSGATGSNEENEANTKAGIIMRHFNKRFPQYLE
jgi:hypothetical protein